MRLILVPALALLFAAFLGSCKSASTPPPFCDTSCFKEPLKFEKAEHPLKPHVEITANNCNADSIVWNYTDMGTIRRLAIADVVGGPIKLNKDNIKCFIKDTSYAWLSFNDCSNGRGYLMKIPFNSRDKISNKSSALNGFDHKFSIADGLIAYSDRGNLFVEDMATAKTAMMTFGQRLDIDYDAIHEYIDSVNVTPTRIWARVLIGKDWKVLEKPIELK